MRSSPASRPRSRSCSRRRESVTDYVELTGNAAPVLNVKLIARVEGYLDEQHFHDGAFVKKGDLLFTIQQDQYKAQLQQAQAQVLAAKAALVYARTEVARYRELVKKDAAAQVEVDHWVYERQAAEANLLGAEAQVVIAKLNLGYTQVRAPFDGQMGKALIDPGNVVGSPGQQAALAEITQLDPIYAVANLNQQDVLKIRANLDQKRLEPRRSASRCRSMSACRTRAAFLTAARSNMSRRGSIRRPERCWCAACLRTRTATCCPGFSSACACRWSVRHAARCWYRTGHCRKIRAAAICWSSTSDNVVEKRYVQLGEAVRRLARDHLGADRR